MGWGVDDYPQPNLIDGGTCTKCRHAMDADELFVCQALDCQQVDLCLGCSFECSDCEEQFCAAHIVIRPCAEPGWSEHRCQPCDAKRQERLKEAA
jgi:hypothetical protein